MSAISSVYIPHIKKDNDAEFIAYIFERNLIAQVSRVAIEYNKKTKKYSAFVGIHAWCDTEIAYNFLHRLKNPKKEARIVYRDDEWWLVEVNKFPHKLSANKKRALTIFREPHSYSRIDYPCPVPPDFLPYFDDEDLDPDQDLDCDNPDQDPALDLDRDQDAIDFEEYMREIEQQRMLIVYEMNGLF